MTEHERGIELARALGEELGVSWADLRRIAAEYLADDYDERGITDADIGSSDVSIALSEMARHEPRRLRSEAELVKERNELVARVAKGTGKSEAETLENLRRLFAPADEDEGRYGHCDTCGALCDEQGCTVNRDHVVAIPG